MTDPAARQEAPWGWIQWLASAALGNAAGVTVGRVTINPGAANPRHVHDNCEEVLYVLHGQIEHSVGGDTVRLGDGDVLVVPAGVTHHAANIGSAQAELFVAYSSGDRAFRVVEDEPG